MAATASTEKMDMEKDLPKKKLINTNLISLKCLLFVFFGGIGCLFPFLPLHMTKVGLNIENVRFVSMVSPAVAILGPLIAGPIADKLAGRQSNNDKSSTGRYLRVMIAVACIFSALFYSLLLLVPSVGRNLPLAGKGPDLKFNCDRRGAMEDREETKKARRYVMAENEPPHLCYKDEDDNIICHVYTEYSGVLPVNGSFGQALNPENEEEWCAYPMAEYFACRIPPELEVRMAEFNQSCSIECDLVNPYTLPGSVLAESQCQRTGDWAEAAFWMYLIVRSIADIFPTTAVALIDAAVVIATRETSCGRGDVGRQLAFGSLGFALLGPLTGYLSTLTNDFGPAYWLPLVLHAALMILTAVIALSANGMPLSPPEWWWHTRSGMLALPMSAIKRYGSETVALVFILLVMGTFWSAMDSYLPLHLQKLGGDELSIGVAMTVGAIPAFLFLWKSEHLVDYCGHSNLLITAFTVYIIRFTGLSLVSEPWWSLITEALEVFTLGIMWVTAILYLRHLVPRHLTVTAQALPVIAHFCVGRCLGAVVGAYINFGDEDIVESLRFVYRCMAIAAAIVAGLYFVLYHGLLKPRCHAHTIQGPRQPPTIVQAAIKDYELSK
ncbi:macrophage mhc class i receptor 2-like protein [Lasius niger]|uniref:Macrophage mhc class i receptor 2-like protein n=1 Tax=Lasius niger TaxID=67767 RepID=A0A0J7L676_LASNI|nr:macrophage mhc class i receptor 2-like protein [Lasius niger]